MVSPYAKIHLVSIPIWFPNDEFLVTGHIIEDAAMECKYLDEAETPKI